MRKGVAPFPVTGLATEQLTKWAAETEIAAGQGASSTGGKWKVRLITASNRRDAMAGLEALRVAGYDARIRKLQDGRYQVRITHLSSSIEAKALAGKLTGQYGITAPTIGR